ncbi:MAG: tRNA (adenosine(37)-N6)-dimethylallyltransferase MiaA [Clostridium sp.]|nr:tRNA (adenosine(37)-N6)-dimethylallyltransferase MiaA [Clostridium sp.]
MKGKLLVITGPTSVGKSSVAVEVAKSVGGEIISADSVQVYRGLDIGAAKPSRAERDLVPHHLLDLVEPNNNFSVAQYQQHATKVIAALHKEGKLPILVGGTGLYLRAVVKGFAFGEDAEDELLRSRLRQEAKDLGAAALHSRLSAVDPRTAAKLHPNDLRRVIRALEFYEISRQSISEQLAATPDENVYDTLLFCLTMPRELLYQRIEMRVEEMLAAGFVEEVRGLLADGASPDAKSMQSLGYKQLVAYLSGRLSLPAAVAEIKRDTRRFAKRQLTWFRREEELIWLDLSKYSSNVELVANISKRVAGYFRQESNI